MLSVFNRIFKVNKIVISVVVTTVIYVVTAKSAYQKTWSIERQNLKNQTDLMTENFP